MLHLSFFDEPTVLGAPYIIAEIGSNWQTKEDCLKSIELIGGTEADAVKFQLFTHEALYGYPGTMPGELNPAWLPDLYSCAIKNGLMFMCSAFSTELIRAVNPYVRVHKLASAEITHLDMLDTLNEIGKPVLVSTGGASKEQVDTARSKLSKCKVCFMYCVPAYPATSTDWKDLEAYHEGFSDHSLDLFVIPSGPSPWRFEVIEKHVNPLGIVSPDYSTSLSLLQFKAMALRLKGYMKAVSADEIHRDANHDMHRFHQRRKLPGKDGYYRLKSSDSLFSRDSHP